MHNLIQLHVFGGGGNHHSKAVDETYNTMGMVLADFNFVDFFRYGFYVVQHDVSLVGGLLICDDHI